jgi:hypothetical protein
MRAPIGPCRDHEKCTRAVIVYYVSVSLPPWRNGRRGGLKIPCPERDVMVQFHPAAPPVVLALALAPPLDRELLHTESFHDFRRLLPHMQRHTRERIHFLCGDDEAS